MSVEIKQIYLDKLVRKPMPKTGVFASSKTSNTLDSSIQWVDKRSAMKISCETVWDKIHKRMGTVFDKRKVRKTGEMARAPKERYTSDYLETVLGKPAKPARESTLDISLEKESREESEIEERIEEPIEKIVLKESESESDTESDTEKPSRKKSKKDLKKDSEKSTEEEPIEEPIEEVVEEAPPAPVGKKSKRKLSQAEQLVEFQKAVEKLKLTSKTSLNGRPLLPRLPKPEKIQIRAPAYYMSNRKLYMQKLSKLFEPYRKEIADDVANASCDRQGSEDFQLLIHQRIVRDYLHSYTPYRGLLLYHGLGSGKTCTAIAIAEGMKSERKIYIMTPASLKMNFFSELKKCGDEMYKKKQYWEFVSVEGQPENVSILSKTLSLPVEWIVKQKGAWLMDVSKTESNYGDLSSDQQKQLDAQLNTMIRTKYVDINYNGITDTRFQKLIRDESGKPVNPFDHSTVLIDEVHNFVSRISNKLKAVESIAYKMYHLLMTAENVRIVLMTGTPMINYPNELGILYNILRGTIRTWTFTIAENQKTVKTQLLQMFKQADFYAFDYIDYANGKLTITRNPFGFVNADAPKRRKTGGSPTTPEFRHTSVEVVPPAHEGGAGEEGGEGLETVGGKKQRRTPDNRPKSLRKTRKVKKSKTLEKEGARVDSDEVDSDVVDSDVVDSDVVDSDVVEDEWTRAIRQPFRLKKSVELPDKFELEEKNSTIEAQVERELREYANQMGDPHQGGGLRGGDPIVDPNYKGVYANEQGNITDAEFVSRVKQILRQNQIELVGTETVSIYKALPDDAESFLQLFVEESSLAVKNMNVLKKRILGLTSYYRSAQETLLPRFEKTEKGDIYHIVPVEMSEHQLKTYFRIRSEEVKSEKNIRLIMANTKELYKTAASYRIFSRSACNFVFPPEITRPMPDPQTTKKQMTEDELDNTNDANTADMKADENLPSRIENGEYQDRIKMALTQLSAQTESAEPSPYITREGLAKLSPKFLRMLENVENTENKGLHLVYSNFRSLEGIGIFKLVLEANGFVEFKLKRNGEDWEIDDAVLKSSNPRFVLYTGTETTEEKEIIRNIYNSQWELVPASIAAKLRETAENNHYGEIIRVLMITASGAEGINLANTRFVHIMEPYWHMVRIDQVIGRARRICSHKNLPEELRTVKVFLYVSVFSDSQRINREYNELMNRDVNETTKTPMTTDEALYEIALRKERIHSQLLQGIKESAVDCRLYKKANASENIVCYGEGVEIKTNDFGIFPSLEEDQLVREDINLREVKTRVVKITFPGKSGEPAKTYMRMGEKLYDYEKYMNTKELVWVANYVDKRVVPV